MLLQQENQVKAVTLAQREVGLLRGFGLLEMLFVIVIIATLLIASISYWQSNRNAVLVEQGYELIQDIIEAAQGWQPKYIDKGKYQNISANALLQEGNIAGEYITNFDGKDGLGIHLGPIHITIRASTGLTTPWHGNSEVNVDQSSPGVLHITFTKIPNYACVNLANRINGENAEVRGGEDSAQCHVKGTSVISHIKSLITSQPNSTLDVYYYPDS